jgi:hypothetical protein
MSHRPLIPALLSFIAGIMIGRLTLPYDQFLIFPIFLLISIALIVFTLIPSSARRYLHLPMFILLGLILTLSSIAARAGKKKGHTGRHCADTRENQPGHNNARGQGGTPVHL